MAARDKQRALAYLRRSTDKQEISLHAQLDWAMAEADRQGLRLEATPADLERMQVGRLHAYKALRLDDGLTGADLTRPGFLALIHDARNDPSISHLLIYQRDRFARPEDAIKMVAIEKDLRLAGLTIVFADGVAAPLIRGRPDLAADIAMMLGYYESGDYLRKLAERVLDAQQRLAKDGFRTGGHAPYGFVRVLVDASGHVLEELPPGRHVRQSGCHVRIVPKDPTKLAVWVYLLALKHKGWGYKRIAQHLNELGIPSPGAGSYRTDQGVRHQVSGRWSPNTVKELCENRAILGLQDYGRRSEGAHRRLGEQGPRLLTEADYGPGDRLRVTRNDTSVQITASIGSTPHFDPQRWQELRQQIAQRGRSQRGIPRAKDPARYPLSCRIVDLSDGCGAIMYGVRHSGRPSYLCGRYQRTAGAECEHNLVDAEAVLRFTLKTLRQLVERHGGRERLQALLEERARRAMTDRSLPAVVETVIGLEHQLEARRTDLMTVQRRMALERDDVRYEALATEFDRLRSEVQALDQQLASQRQVAASPSGATLAGEVEAALAVFDAIERITSDERARAEIHPLLVQLGLWLGLSFSGAIKGRTRVVRQLVGGVMTFGQGRLPIPLHGARNAAVLQETGACAGVSPEGAGPAALGSRGGTSWEGPADCDTGSDAETVSAPALGTRGEPSGSGISPREGVSFTKDSRGDRTSIELFRGCLRDWPMSLVQSIKGFAAE